MRNIIFILITLVTGNVAFSQIVNIQQADSLRKELAKVEHDTSRAIILADLAEAYRSEKADSSLYFADEVLRLSRNINYPFGEMRAYLVLCFYFQNAGNDPSKALETGLKALDITEKYHFEDFEAGCLIRLGQVHLILGNLREAFIDFQRANRLSANGVHPFFHAVTYWWLANTYLRMEKPDSALYLARIAYDKAVEIKNDRVLGQALQIIGRVYALKGNNELAKQYYHQRISAASRMSEYSDIAGGYLSLAFLFRDLKQNDSAIFYAKKAFDLVQPRAYIGSINAAGRLLSGLLESSDPAEALRYLKIADVARDSSNNIQKIQSAQAMVFKEKERQAELGYEKKAYQSRVRQTALLVGIGVLLLGLLGLIRNNRSKQRANRALEKQKKKVEETLVELRSTQAQLIQSEKMASLGEMTAGIAHEIQNPLNFVNNFSEVNDELLKELKAEADNGNLKEVKAIANDIAFNSEKINQHGKRASSIVKGMLQHSRTSSGQKEPTDINALADEYLRLAYHGLRAKDKSFTATTKTEFDNNIDKIEVVPQEIGRVILNLINNAFYAVNEKQKHVSNAHPNDPRLNDSVGQAVGGGYEPTVVVSTSKNPPSGGKGAGIEIKVKDNGNGIPPAILDKIFQPFFTTKPTGQGTGLGLSLSYDIITKGHGGEMKVETKEGEGSEFIIHLPV